MMLVVLFVLLTLYFLSFDFAASREPYVYVRDLALVTLAYIGFGWHAFRIAHH
jgi:predicted tellurium resistance membrane protein TerC